MVEHKINSISFPCQEPQNMAFETVKDHVVKLFHADMHMPANQLIDKVAQLTRANNLFSLEGKPVSQMEFNSWLNSEVVKTELEHGKKFNSFFEVISDLENWT